MKSALICGVNGQDGAYLAMLLLEKGYKVWGTSRDGENGPLSNLHSLDIRNRIQMLMMLPTSYEAVCKAIDASHPDEIYYLASQSSVGLSFSKPMETYESATLGLLNILEAVRLSGGNTRIFNAGSSECFGDTHGVPADESTAFSPKSPYAAAKVSAYWLSRSYRESFGVFATTGILFNHESPLRSDTFVTRKIVRGALNIAAGRESVLELGELDIYRDWGWAPEYVEAMWLTMQHDTPDDYVLATGETNSLQSFVEIVFSDLNLDWKKHVRTNDKYRRANEVHKSIANPAKASQILGWSARSKMRDVVRNMISAERGRHV